MPQTLYRGDAQRPGLVLCWGTMIENDRTVRADDGTLLAYAVAGAGPAIVLTNGLTTTSFFWKYVRPLLLERHTVLTWDLPGHGRSGRAESAASVEIEGQPTLLARVMDAAGVERATQIGWSVGCQVVLEMYRQQAARCDALALLFGPAECALSNTALPLPGWLLHALVRPPLGLRHARVLQAIAPLAVQGPLGAPLLRRSGLIGDSTSPEDLRELVADLGRVDPDTGTRMACSAERHSALDVLARIRIPLLIMAGEDDPFAPPESVGARMHRVASGSVFVRLPGARHTALLDHPRQIVGHLEHFLAQATGRAA